MSDTLYESLRTKWSIEYAKQYKTKNNITGKLSTSIKQSNEYKNGRVEYIANNFKKFYSSNENQHRKEVVENTTNDLSEKQLNHAINTAIHDLTNRLQTGKLKYQGTIINIDNIMNYVREIEEVPNAFLKNALFKKGNLSLMKYAENCFRKYIDEEFEKKKNSIAYYLDEYGNKIEINLKIKKEYLDQFFEKILETFTSETILKCLEKNQCYLNFREEIKRTEKVLKEIPKNFIDLYPKARMLQRHFVLHIGGTNSGKTYQSLERLKEVETGIYLAPLRLLALEVQEKMLENNVMCSLSTGEEEDIVPNATHLSATVEKLNISKTYDLCVIDEVQMIQDRSRGWAWTRAILGVCANEVHLCMSEDAKDITIKLIEECGDTYEIIKHERNTELIFENKPFNYPQDIKDHDALIVFSRKNVLSVASELENKGFNVSILYGALPYPVRKNELKKFMNGETNILVATDCVGLGLNVPIKRIVFLQTSKYDGFENRMLNISEVKQIAGRAGRYGIYDKGYVNSIQDGKYIKRMLESNYKSIQLAKINFPETLLNLDENLSDTLITWSKITDSGIFVKTDIERDLMLCRYLEQFNIEKTQMLSLINMPFDERNETILYMWQRFVKKYVENKLDLKKEIKLMPLTDNLEELELAHKKFDLVFSFMKAINYTDEDVYEIVKDCKLKISLKIIEILKKQKTSFKRCSKCGKKMAWNYQYGMCQDCFQKQHSYHKWYDVDDDFDDDFWDEEFIY